MKPTPEEIKQLEIQINRKLKNIKELTEKL